MASYLEQYQYDQVQPANTNVEQIAKSFQTKMAYWQQGASQVKNAYQNYLGLSLTNSTNKQQLEDYMKSAKEEILKASNADLSIGENVTNTLGVFENLTNGKSAYSENILGDHKLTSHYAAQEEAIKNAKTKDKGVGYNAANEQYMRDGYNDFAQDQDPNNWKKHMQNKKSYESYYDYTNEYRKILDDCTANKTSSTSEVDKSLYFREVSDNSLTSSKLNGCLESGLSSKAKRQLQIEGYVNFGKNYAQLASTYNNFLTDEAKALTSQQQEDQAVLSQLKNLKVKSPTDLEQIALYEQRIASYKPQFENIAARSEGLSKDNYKFISDNYETVAGQVYTKLSQQRFANSFSSIAHSDKLIPNQARMLEYREGREDQRTALKIQSDFAMEDTKFQHSKELEQMKALSQMNIAQAKGLMKAGAKVEYDQNGQPILTPSQGYVENVPFNEANAEKRGKADFNKLATDNLTRLLDTEIKFSSKLLDNPQIQKDLTSGDSVVVPDWKDPKTGKVTKGLVLNTRNADEKQQAINYFKQNPAIFTSTPFYQTLKNRSLSSDPNKFEGSYGNIVKEFARDYNSSKAYVDADKAITRTVEEAIAREPEAKIVSNINSEINKINESFIYNMGTPKGVSARRMNIKDIAADIKNNNVKIEVTRGNVYLRTRISDDHDIFSDVNERIPKDSALGQKLVRLKELMETNQKEIESLEKKRNLLFENNNYKRRAQVNITDMALSQGAGTFATVKQVLTQDMKGKSKRFNINHVSTTNEGGAVIDVDIIDAKVSADDVEAIQKELNNKTAGANVEPVEGFPNRIRIRYVNGSIQDDIVNVRDLTEPLKVNEMVFNTVAKTNAAQRAADFTPVHEQPYTSLNGSTFVTTMVKTPNGFIYQVGKIVDGQKIPIQGAEYTTSANALAFIKSASGDIDSQNRNAYYRPSNIDASNYNSRVTTTEDSAEAE